VVAKAKRLQQPGDPATQRPSDPYLDRVRNLVSGGKP